MNADLILWRHAEAEDLADNDETGGNDLSRRLTHKGEKQAARMAAWLQHRPRARASRPASCSR